MLDLFLKFQDVCNDLNQEWEVYKEIDKQARLQAEYNQVHGIVDETSKLVSEYEDFLRKQEVTLHTHQEGDKTKISQEKKPGGAEIQQIDKLISQLENSLAEIGRQQRDIYSKLATPENRSPELPIQMSETEPLTRQPEWMIPDVGKKAQSSFSRERTFNVLKSSTPKASPPVDNVKDSLTATHELRNAGHVPPQTGSTENHEDPFKGLTRLPIPKFRGDKRSFESWYAGFHQIVGRHKKVPPEQKLLRLYSCLEGEALRTIQNLGYSSAAYDIAIARLVRKYGGKRRELTMRLEELDKFRGVREGNANDLERFAELLDTLIVKLCDAGQEGELGAGSLYVSLLRKLNEQLIVKYQDWLRERHLEGNVRNLHAFVNDEAESWMVALETVKGLTQQKTKGLTTGSTLAVTQVSVEKKNVREKCKLCSKEHGLWQCSHFKALPVEKRWDKARELRVCFCCLSSSHRSKTCRRARCCSIDGCRSNHHRMLHSGTQERVPSGVSVDDNPVGVPKAETVDNDSSSKRCMEGEPGSGTFVTSLSKSTEYLPLRTIPVIVKNGNKSMRINALLDDGSTRSYINEDVADCLGLEGEAVSLSVRLLNDTTTSLRSRSVQFDLESCDGRVRKTVAAQTTKRVTGNMRAINWSHEKNKWSHLNGINFPSLGRRPTIDMLIGLDLSDLHCSLKEVRGKPGEPIARLTPLGWTSIGSFQQNSGGEVNHMSFLITEERQLDSLIKQMWEIEEPQSCALVRPQDIEAEQTVLASLKQTSDGYMVGLPWKSVAPSLENNYTMALTRLESTERKLAKQPEIATAYQGVINSYKQKGYIREVQKEDEQVDKVWYLPHFPVVRQDKSTSKVRPVFDASAKYKGVSLNDVLHQGPKLQNDLVSVLTRFRRSPIALVCDITEMYLQVHLQPADRSVHRFLWRDMNKDVPPKVYEFTRVVFGVNASPYLAQLVAQHNAKINSCELPRAAETVCESTYMDDSLDSVETIEEAVKLHHDLTTLWKRAGMTPKKWLSNSEEVLKVIPKDHCVNSLDLEAQVMPVIKTLGISWESSSDQFTFVVHPPPDDFFLTKRSFLSRTSTLFDPLGFVSPFTVRARMMLQAMWTAGLTWDQKLPAELAKGALTWFKELPALSRIKIPRSLKEPEQVADSQLHVFTDASQEAYGAVAYLRHEYQSGNTTVRFVMSRAKVTPLQSISVPRLELMAAIVGLQIAETVGQTIGLPKEKWTFWSDSLDVLHWVRGHSRQFKPFVSNRVAEIQMKTDPTQWRYTPTKENPADKLSRGMTANSLATDHTWWNGPEYLSQPEEMWPKMCLPSINSDDVERKQKHRVTLFASSEREKSLPKLKWKGTRLDPERFSDWFKYLRVVAYVIRFIQNSSKVAKVRGPLTVEEVNDAEIMVLRQVQQESFSDELSQVCKGEALSTSSKISPISPSLGSDGVLRGNSRLRLADHIAWEARHPIILPRKHPVTKLIVERLHKDSNHSGTNQVLALLSAKFWLPGAREEIRDCERACMVCRRRKVQPASQIMAPLPAVRTQMSLRAFTNISVDFAGPFLTKQGRGKTRFKRYLCLFACMNTRAVHLEMAYGLDTDSFLNAIYRMTSRRGFPAQVISDNGTNFVGAARELRELVNALDKTKIQELTVNRGVVWRFNPPSAPHFNGLHEILIKAAKRAMFHVLNKADLTDEELMTTIVGAEGLINFRPITYQSSNADDAEPLTPNHFLFNQVGGQFAPESVDTEPFNPRVRWRHVQEVVRHFWKRWLTEWLPSLSPRKKWGKEKRDLGVGDLVLVLSTDTPRGKWPLGRIIEVFPGPDGHVRTADVKVKGSILRRPIVKLCPLECEA